jgi:hypothetical protein
MDNAFNSNGSTSEARKDLLRKLGEAVKTTFLDLSADKQKQVAEDYRQLAEQATKPHPNKRWVRTALDGITEVALTLAATGKPILDLISQVPHAKCWPQGQAK